MHTAAYRQRQADECDRLAALARDPLARSELLVSACEWRLFSGNVSRQAPMLRLLPAVPVEDREEA
jgi:hypothetical protein